MRRSAASKGFFTRRAPSATRDMGIRSKRRLLETLHLRNLMRIPGKDDAVPEYRCEGRIHGHRVEVIFSGTGQVIIPTQSLGQAADAQGAKTKEYLVFRKSEEYVIERNLKRKHGDLTWKRRPGDDGRGTVELRAAFDVRTLCSPEMNRMIAKFGLNLMAQAFGVDTVSSRFAELKHFIQTGEHNSAPPAGIIYEPNVTRHIPTVPPKHVLILFRDGAEHRTVSFISLFSLFPFCVVASDLSIGVDAFKSQVINPYDGSLVTLFATRPYPEVRLARSIAKLPRGGLEQAIAIAKRAHRWVLDNSDGNDSVICYECGRVLEAKAISCQYCGGPSAPEKRGVCNMNTRPGNLAARGESLDS